MQSWQYQQELLCIAYYNGKTIPSSDNNNVSVTIWLVIACNFCLAQTSSEWSSHQVELLQVVSQDGVFDHHEHEADVLRVSCAGEVGVHRLLLVGVLVHVHLQDELLGRFQVLLRSCRSGKVIIFSKCSLLLYLYGWAASTSLSFLVTIEVTFDFTVEANVNFFVCVGIW